MAQEDTSFKNADGGLMIKITYEHPPHSGKVGCSRVFNEDFMLESGRGRIRAGDVVVGDCLKTTPIYKSKVLDIEVVN